jgi:sugar transferase (PEP-CTERM/EpsH1 system associated)
MKILFVCHRFPFPPKRGGKIRPFNMVKHLSRTHEVTVASLVRSEQEAREGHGLKEHCHRYLMERVRGPAALVRMLYRLPTSHPSSMGYFYSPRLASRIRQELRSKAYDLIFVHCSSVAPYVADATSIPKILDFGDMDSQKWLTYGEFKRFPVSLGYYYEGLKLQLAETRLARQFDCCTCTTRAELKTLDGLLTARKTDWFPNGVDSEAFQPDGTPYDPDTICFVGRMDYYPNQECMFDFCANTLPLIRDRHSNVKLLIVGADPSRQVRRLEAIPGVTVTGSVPEVQPHVRRAALTIAPLNIARGTQNKIIESLAMGVPAVCSKLAAGGVDAVPGKHLLVAGDPGEYADAIVRLLNDPAERKRYSEAGRERVLSHHSWESSMRQLDRIIAACLGNTQSNVSAIQDAGVSQ